MRINDVLRVKGAEVVTVTPDTTVRHLLQVLAEHNGSTGAALVDYIYAGKRLIAKGGAAVIS